ncbi:RNA 2'-phosphotransferase [Paenarthrobacter nitroguajacolicus]|uniref:RNA 2'-phosphotransferase n=1 Tax=Paenarthrobacter nitroguajacolicus TaxID=211146 RepID=UPI0037C8F232
MNCRPSPSEISRVLSHALRHAPGEYSLVLDREGWVSVSELLGAMRGLGHRWESVDEKTLNEVLETAEKKRHQMVDGRIRALHGHSVPVAASHKPSQPPPVLFHGTAPASVPLIEASGILPMQRQYVHLAETVEQATAVGKRKDKHPVVLTIATDVAQSLGVVFYRADSAIWLADPIPAAAVGLIANEYDMYLKKGT